MPDKKVTYLPVSVDGVVTYCQRREFKGEIQEGYAVDVRVKNSRGREAVLSCFSDNPVKLGEVKGLKLDAGVGFARILS